MPNCFGILIGLTSFVVIGLFLQLSSNANITFPKGYGRFSWQEGSPFAPRLCSRSISCSPPSWESWVSRCCGAYTN